jgi:DNA-binding HxlR family transcriptional regulator
MESDSTISIIEAIYDMPELKACPIQTTFKVIGKKWTILILREMFRGVTQFNRFLERITGLTPKLIINRLKELQKSRIITRKVVSESPIRIEYHLTDLGKKLEPVLVAAGSFSMSSMPNEVFKDGKARKPEEIIRMKLVT